MIEEIEIAASRLSGQSLFELRVRFYFLATIFSVGLLLAMAAGIVFGFGVRGELSPWSIPFSVSLFAFAMMIAKRSWRRMAAYGWALMDRDWWRNFRESHRLDDPDGQ